MGSRGAGACKGPGPRAGALGHRGPLASAPPPPPIWPLSHLCSASQGCLQPPTVSGPQSLLSQGTVCLLALALMGPKLVQNERMASPQIHSKSQEEGSPGGMEGSSRIGGGGLTSRDSGWLCTHEQRRTRKGCCSSAAASQGKGRGLGWMGFRTGR